MQALILAGGSGTRFWPASRRRRPKQLLSLEGEVSLLRATVERLEPLIPARSVWVCTTEALAPEVRRELPGVPAEQILAEPVGRNTAPAIGWSLRSMPREVRDGVVAVLPADHRVADPAAFRDALERAAVVCEADSRIMTLGVVPTRPETGFGYLELDAVLDRETGLRRVCRFTEKPDLETAKRFVEGGDHLWNAGIFVFRGTTLLELMEGVQPELAVGLEAIADQPSRTRELYPSLPSVSIDHGLIEKLDDLGTLPLDCGWSDLGSWAALWEILDRDADGNAGRGDHVAVAGSDNLLFADEGMIAVAGVSGLVVVKAGDAVLVVPRERSQEVREIVAELERRGRSDLL